MKWYYALGSNQMGPVSDVELGDLARAGKIQAGTLVWHAGQDGWLPYSQIAAGAGLPQAAAPPPQPAPIPFAPTAAPAPYAPTTAVPVASAPGATAYCAACGQQFDSENMIHYMGSMICMGCKPAYFQRMREGAAAPGGSGLSGYTNYAGFWIRFAAKFIDGLIIGVPAIVIFFVVMFAMGLAISGASNRGNPGGAVAMQMVQLIFQFGINALFIAYSTFMHGKYGATLGKMAVGIKVVMADGQPVTYGRALGRGCAEILSGCVCDIGYIIAAFDDEKRALHDHMCGTRVVRK